jgi:hypothetical protein
MGPTAGLDLLEKRKIPCFCQDFNLRSYSSQPCHYTKAPNRKKIKKNKNK